MATYQPHNPGVVHSAELISRVTDSVKELLDEWRTRSLESVYPVLFLDALVINVKEGSHVVKKAVYLALAIRSDGHKELLGLWIDQNEGAKFWLGILNELRNRGIQDILIAAVDGLTGFPEAINAVFPKTKVQLCVVHVIRNSLKYVPFKDRKTGASDLKNIYTAPSEETASIALETFAEKWDKKYPMISQSWRTRWPEVIPFLKFPEIIRKAVYTTYAIESVNFTIRKVIKNRQSFPTNEAAMKLIFMALQNISKKWTMPLHNWGEAINQFAIIYGDRVPIQNRLHKIIYRIVHRIVLNKIVLDVLLSRPYPQPLRFKMLKSLKYLPYGILFLLSSLVFSCVSTGFAPKVDGLVVLKTEVKVKGAVKKIVGFESRFLDLKRNLYVYTPPGYDQEERRYPVIYTLDGNNLFNKYASPGHNWRLEILLNALISTKLIQPLLVVGIGNTQNRTGE